MRDWRKSAKKEGGTSPPGLGNLKEFCWRMGSCDSWLGILQSLYPNQDAVSLAHCSIVATGISRSNSAQSPHHVQARTTRLIGRNRRCKRCNGQRNL